VNNRRLAERLAVRLNDLAGEEVSRSHHGSLSREARTEIEEETTAAIFEAMWPLTKGHRLRKRRFRVDVDDRTWELDEFKNRELVLAEIELDSEDEPVTFPDWLAPAVQREVTTEPAFQNINLAR